MRLPSKDTDNKEFTSPIPHELFVGVQRAPRWGSTGPSLGFNEPLVGVQRETYFSCKEFYTILLAILFLLPAAALRGQGDARGRGGAPDSLLASRPVERATMYGLGWANMYDTYLSPQEYRGIEFRLSRESLRQTRWGGGRWVRQAFFQGYANYTHNHVDNNNTLAALVNWNYGVLCRLWQAGRFRLLAGGLADLSGGFVWNMRNGNNPASARASVAVDASVAAAWDFRVRRVPFTLRYQLDVPLLGAMFSPHYGQSYYEIFSLGNAGGVVKFTSLHNAPSWRHRLSLDFPAGRLRMRLTYLWDAQQADVNHIETHAYSHVFMVGFVKQFSLLPNP